MHGRQSLSSLDTTSSHYDTLGVAPSASNEEIRQAYRALARALHPDRHMQSTPPEREAAERRMQEVNAAWAVIGNPTGRALYDAELSSLLAHRAAGPARTATAGAGAGPGAGPTLTATSTLRPRVDPRVVEPASPWGSLFRGMPWLLVLAVLGFIFVFTAFAARNGSDGHGGPAPAPTTTTVPRARSGDCINVASPNGIIVVDCQGAHDARITTMAPLGRPCPPNTREMYLPDEGQTACLDFTN